MTKLNTISKKLRTQIEWKKLLMFLLVMVVSASSIWAEGEVTALDSAVAKVTDFLSSGVITAICLIALVVEGIGVVVMGKQGADIQAIIGKFAPWVIGTVVLLSANGICNYFLSDITF